jgi:hypothetical protein
MGMFGYILAGCIALAVLQALGRALALLLPIILVAAVVRWPWETLGLFGFLVVARLLRDEPVGCLMAVTLLGVAGIIARRCDSDDGR